MSDERKPDALMVPIAMAGGGDARAKMRRLAEIARPLLGLDAGTPINVPIPPPGPGYFVRKGPHDHGDTLMFATDHDRAGESRYRWEGDPDGIRAGYLVDGA